MFGIKVSSDWKISESDITSEEIYLNRRQFIESAGKLGSNILALSALSDFLIPTGVFAENSTFGAIARRDQKNIVALEDKVTSENLTSRYNNFYEFGTNKTAVSLLAKKLQVRPWKIKIEGLVNKPMTLDVDKIIQAIHVEQRVYRLLSLIHISEPTRPY